MFSCDRNNIRIIIHISCFLCIFLIISVNSSQIEDGRGNSKNSIMHFGPNEFNTNIIQIFLLSLYSSSLRILSVGSQKLCITFHPTRLSSRGKKYQRIWETRWVKFVKETYSSYVREYSCVCLCLFVCVCMFTWHSTSSLYKYSHSTSPLLIPVIFFSPHPPARTVPYPHPHVSLSLSHVSPPLAHVLFPLFHVSFPLTYFSP